MAFELLKSVVRNENDFKDFIAVPSILDTSKYTLLNILSVDIGECKSWKEYLSNLLGGKKADLTNVGKLSVKTNQFEEVTELIDKAFEEKICYYDPKYSLTKANSEYDLEIPNAIKMSGDKSSHMHAMLDLGLITKRSLSYEQITEMLKKLNSFSEDFIKMGKKDHLLIIYEVVYAEKLKDLRSSTTKTTSEADFGSTPDDDDESICSMVSSPEQERTLASGKGAGFSTEDEVQHGKSLWRPEEFGPFPIAYKCGQIRLICHEGGRKSLKLTKMSKFYEPFDATDSHFHIPTSNEPSLEASQ